MKTQVMVTAALASLLSWPALACTPEEAEAKAEQLATKLVELTQSDPQKAEEIRQELREMKLKTSAKELPTDCEVYDRRLQELEDAAQEAGQANLTSEEN